MSEDQEQKLIEELETALKSFGSVGKLIGAIRVLIAGAFLMGGWVALLEWRQREMGESLKQAVATLKAIEVWRARTESDRWSVKDHAKWADQERVRETVVIGELREENRLAELRMQRIEDQQERIMDDLSRRLAVTPADVLREVKKLSGE